MCRSVDEHKWSGHMTMVSLKLSDQHQRVMLVHSCLCHNGGSLGRSSLFHHSSLGICDQPELWGLILIHGSPGPSLLYHSLLRKDNLSCGSMLPQGLNVCLWKSGRMSLISLFNSCLLILRLSLSHCNSVRMFLTHTWIHNFS